MIDSIRKKGYSININFEYLDHIKDIMVQKGCLVTLVKRLRAETSAVFPLSSNPVSYRASNRVIGYFPHSQNV